MEPVKLSADQKLELPYYEQLLLQEGQDCLGVGQLLISCGRHNNGASGRGFAVVISDLHDLP